jgi:hypothetical protein
MQLIGARGEGGGHRASAGTSAPAQHREEYAEARSPMVDNEHDASGFSQDEIPF